MAADASAAIVAVVVIADFLRPGFDGLGARVIFAFAPEQVFAVLVVGAVVEIARSHHLIGPILRQRCHFVGPGQLGQPLLGTDFIVRREEFLLHAVGGGGQLSRWLGGRFWGGLGGTTFNIFTASALAGGGGLGPNGLHSDKSGDQAKPQEQGQNPAGGFS